MELFTHPNLPLHYIGRDEEDRLWLVSGSSGERRPRIGLRFHMASATRVAPEMERVLLATWDRRVS